MYSPRSNDPVDAEVNNIDDYQTFTGTTAKYPGELAIEYLALGLVSEAGEVAGIIKKQIRDGKDWTGEQREEMRRLLIKELGDVCWYVARIAWHLGISMSRVLAANVAKLTGRAARGTIGGSGDNR